MDIRFRMLVTDTHYYITIVRSTRPHLTHSSSYFESFRVIFQYLFARHVWVHLHPNVGRFKLTELRSMKIAFFGVALVSFLLGAIAIYAYYNRNRYTDILFAAGAAFLFGVGMLLTAFSIALQISNLLKLLSELSIIISAGLLILRLGEDLAKKLSRFLTKKNHDDKDDL